MFIEAAICLSEMVDPESLKAGALYPPLEQLRNISALVAATTIECAIRDGQSKLTFSSRGEVLAFVHAGMWSPPQFDEPATFYMRADGDQAADYLDEDDTPHLCT
mmetsp:Transcript_44243/g.109538  ORF Transcript_44243/g.109538 Transcript_44243/m.109538 type:complete len:105 (+) Transcript_44243:1302-1616(+)